jgi:hypothetical protein
MNKYEHLNLPVYKGNIERVKKPFPQVKPKHPNKPEFVRKTLKEINTVIESSKKQKMNTSLIFEMEVNKHISHKTFEEKLNNMGIEILATSEKKDGYCVVFSSDQELTSFKTKLNEYSIKNIESADPIFDVIEKLHDIPREKKIGKLLKEKPLGERAEFIDIELWNIDPSTHTNDQFIEQLKNTHTDPLKFKITDQLTTKSFVLLRVKLTKEIFDEIIDSKVIFRADRPFTDQFSPAEYLKPDIRNIQINPPPENATGILIIDSGIISNHPMLEKCVGDQANFQDGEQEEQDIAGHGTAVAGCAAYGDIQECLNKKEFTPSNKIFSAKVMYANTTGNQVVAEYNPEKLVEHQLKDAIEYFLSNANNNIKVVNISLGDSSKTWQKDYERQLPLAALIDELAFEYKDVVFIVSAGNQDPHEFYDSISDIKNNYPKYLIDNPDFKIINPATAALALTIGSIAQKIKIESERYGAEAIKTPIAEKDQPSPFTRTGFGINGMVKPELVEYGGNLILFRESHHFQPQEDKGEKIIVLNNQLTEQIMKFEFGTSFSAPKVAHIAGQIANKYPQRSANFIKNLLLIGADYPFEPDDYFYGSIPTEIGFKKFQEAVSNHLLEPAEKVLLEDSYTLFNYPKKQVYKLKSDFEPIKKNNVSNVFKKISLETNLSGKDHSSVCGYGLPNLGKAIDSIKQRVVLFDEGQIGLDEIKVYSLKLPEIFFSTQGKKKITITLTFNPETRSTRGNSYLGNTMGFHLFHAVEPQTLIQKYGKLQDTEKATVPKKFEKYEIKIDGSEKREKGCHQKAIKTFKREPQPLPQSPISLVLINQNKWLKTKPNEERMQDYCVSVTFEHEKEIELYNALRANVQERVRL